MMSVMSELVPSLQRLVDARLDAIERHLIDARMPRNERRDIVSSVEDQIFELLGRTGKEEPSREDVLQVLCSIDPPEAYANVDRPAGRSATIPDDNMVSVPNAHSAKVADNKQSQVLPIIACATGSGSLVLGLLAVPLLFTGELLSLAAISLALILGIVALVCGFIGVIRICRFDSQLRGLAASTIGLVSVPVAAFFCCYCLLVLINQ